MPNQHAFPHPPLLAKADDSAGSGGVADSKGAAQIHYPAGSQPSFQGPEAYFTGEVQVQVLFPENEDAHFSGAYVTFQPCARTAWHHHPGGQHMVVTSGVALTGTRDGTVFEFNEGEAVWCPADIDHWHGATPHQAMTHLVITGSRDGANVVWKEHVSDAEYFRAQPQEKAMPELDALTARQQAIVPVAAFTASGDSASLKAALASALDAGLSINELKEIAIHLYAYAGFPRALNALGVLMGLVDERRNAGITDALGKEASGLSGETDSLELGRRVQTELAGQPVSGPLFDFAPAINRFLQSHLFGDLFARDTLDYPHREVATLSALAGMAGVDAQLQAHVGIAINVGLSETQLRALASVLRSRVGEQTARRVEVALQAAFAAAAEAPADDR